MNPDEFRLFGKAAVDYLADYIENIRSRKVIPDVERGYLHKLLPENAPLDPDHWTAILPDVERFIMPGITHWQSPRFNGYYPTASSFPSIVGELLSAGIGCMGFNWLASPACTELEVIVLDWLGKMINLPDCFLSTSPGPGGGVIHGSASEATLLALLVAKEKLVHLSMYQHQQSDAQEIKSKMIAYTSDQANCSVERAGLLASVPIKLLPTDEHGQLTGQTLQSAINEDRMKGLIPCCVIATLGTTGTCSYDKIDEIGPICEKEKVWLHVDAAYAGSACICPEYQYILKGVEFADSFNMNPHKWLLVNFDFSATWFKDPSALQAFNVDRVYLEQTSELERMYAPEYRHWQIPLGRRFRALKFWITVRLYGVSGLQQHIRSQCELAQQFSSYVKRNENFQLISIHLGLVCFRLKGDDSLTKLLLERLLESRELFMVAGKVQSRLVIRFAICSRITQPEDIDFAWSMISKTAKSIIKNPI